MAPSLSDKVIVITGATGIAAASAKAAGGEGAAVFTVSIDEDECRILGEEMARLGYRHEWAVADLRHDDETGRAVRAAVERFGRLDGLLAVAGGSGRGFGDGPIHDVSLQAWNETLALNLTTSFLSVREAVRAMRTGEHGGSIAIVSSVLADRPSPEMFSTHAYAASKGAQVALATAAAATYAPQGIRVNVISPAVVATPMSTRAQADQRIAGYVERKQPLAGGFIEANAVARAAVFLLSDAASMVTGQVLRVDGGWAVTEAMP